MAQGRSTKIISMMKWIRTRRLSINKSLLLSMPPTVDRNRKVTSGGASWRRTGASKVCNGHVLYVQFLLGTSYVYILCWARPIYTYTFASKWYRTRSTRAVCVKFLVFGFWFSVFGFLVFGFGVWGFGFGIWDLGFFWGGSGVYGQGLGLGFSVWGVEFRVEGLRSRV